MSQGEQQQLASAFIGFVRASGLLQADVTPCGQHLSISTAHALCELAEGPQLHQKALAARLGLTTSATSRLVDQLETKGWATRNEDPNSTDSRVRLVTLTEEGQSAAQRVLDARALRFEQLFDAIPTDDRASVVNALQLLRNATNVIDS